MDPSSSKSRKYAVFDSPNGCDLESLHELWSEKDCMDRIMEKVSKNKSNLWPCLTVSRLFHQASWLFLFSFLNIRLSSLSEVVRNLEDINSALLKKKEVFSYVRTLRLSGAPIHDISNNILRSCHIADQLLDFLLDGLIDYGTYAGFKHPGLGALDLGSISWPELEMGPKEKIIKLMKSSQQLHTIILPVCRNVNCQSLRNLVDACGNIAGLRHLCLRGSDSLPCDHKSISEIQGKEASGIVQVTTLDISRLSNNMNEYLFHAKSPFDFSRLRSVRLSWMEPEEVYYGKVLWSLTTAAKRSLRSLVWQIGSEWTEWFWENLWEPLAKVPQVKNEGFHLRYLTLQVTNSKAGFGIDKAFSMLTCELGVNVEELEELNIIYPVDDVVVTSNSITSSQRAALESVLQVFLRADEDYQNILDDHQFIQSPKIRLFVQHHRDFPAAKYEPMLKLSPGHCWKSSDLCSKTIQTHAPIMHGTEKLYIKMGTFQDVQSFLNAVSEDPSFAETV